MASLGAVALPALAAFGLVLALAGPAYADSDMKCRKDSGGKTVCTKVDREKAERCTLTCRKDSGGNTVCKERCR